MVGTVCCRIDIIIIVFFHQSSGHTALFLPEPLPYTPHRIEHIAACVMYCCVSVIPRMHYETVAETDWE